VVGKCNPADGVVVGVVVVVVVVVVYLMELRTGI